MSDREDLIPKLWQNRSFWGMNAAQFLGAFNDNLYKQLILLWCLDIAGAQADAWQPTAMLIFAIPFVSLSGFAGYLADRLSKQRIVVLCKWAEVAIMVLGLGAFASRSLGAMLTVLFLMGIHSAFFGPSKYGILPEIVREHDLPSANALFQLTTFLAIICGMVFAGILKDYARDQLWVSGIPCIGFAVCGVIAAHLVRSTPPGNPQLAFRKSDLLMPVEVWHLLKRRWDLTQVLALYSLFWFLGGVVQQTVNAVTKKQLLQDEAHTSAAAGCLAIGIAIGCGLSGPLAHGRIRFSLVRRAAWGMTVVLLLLGIPTHWQFDPLQRDRIAPILGYVGSLPSLIVLGLSAGLFAVPLQVYLQVRSPQDQKGRVMGAMNLCTWIGILGSSVFYYLLEQGLAGSGAPRNLIYASLAVLMLPVALWGINRQDEDSHLEEGD